MMGTINCIYETPCGWCSKWDKKCDTKISCDNNTNKHPLPSVTLTTTRDSLFNLGSTRKGK